MIPSPDGISFVGAFPVVVFYWLHLAALGPGLSVNGDDITIFISVFLAQYIPLTMVKARYREE